MNHPRPHTMNDNNVILGSFHLSQCFPFLSSLSLSLSFINPQHPNWSTWVSIVFLTRERRAKHLQAMTIVPSGKFDWINKQKYKASKKEWRRRKKTEKISYIDTEIGFSTRKWEKFLLQASQKFFSLPCRFPPMFWYLSIEVEFMSQTLQK